MRLKRFFRLGRLFRPLRVKEFPPVHEVAIDRFQSWDRELGWCNQPNCTKVDKSDRSPSAKKATKSPSAKKATKKAISGKAVFSTDEKGSRSCRHPSARSDVSCFGDSFCMCREVHDDETFPWYLGELRGSRVANYGVGNYGLDQALLRLQRDYPQDPGAIVVLAVTSITMARCVSIYRHYLEPGNVFAIKPRFRSGENDDGLHLLEYPLDKKESLLSLREYRNYFRAHDEHYDFWRKSRIYYYSRQLPKKVAARFGIGSEAPPYKTFEYESRFWRSHAVLFLGMMAFYQQLADRHGFKPFFLLQHHKRSLDYLAGKPPEQLPWASTLAMALEKFPAITFLDEADIFADCDDIETLYVGGHHSPNANRMIADYLNRHL